MAAALDAHVEIRRDPEEQCARAAFHALNAAICYHRAIPFGHDATIENHAILIRLLPESTEKADNFIKQLLE